jgi:predicted dehydrogenase
MKTRKPLRALIIGAGKIAAGYDTPESKQILTHAHGFRAVPGFELIGFVDKDRAQAEQAAAKWGGKAFSDPGVAFAEGSIDVVTVATPDGTHAAVLKQLAPFAPRLIFCEKPLALSWAEAEAIDSLYRRGPTVIQVNYLRRFAPEFRAVKQAIAEGRYGRFLTGTGYYVKGFLHNGSHMVDLLRYWLGEISGGQELTVRDNAEDLFAKDFGLPNVADSALDAEKSVLLEFAQGGLFTVHSLPGNPYWIFELDLLFDKKRLRILDSGFAMQQYELGKNPVFPGTQEMLPQPIQPTGLDQAMRFAMENIRNHLLAGEPLLCPLAEALATLKAGLLRR